MEFGVPFGAIGDTGQPTAPWPLSAFVPDEGANPRIPSDDARRRRHLPVRSTLDAHARRAHRLHHSRTGEHL